MKRIFLLVALFSALFSVAEAQFPQQRRLDRRMEQLRKADEDRQRAREEEDRAALSVPKPKPATVNVNVQTVVSTQDVKDLASARSQAVTSFSDGDPAWLYVKFDTRLGDYVLTERDQENDGQFRYLLFAEIGPQGDATALTRYVLEFTRADLELKELKINLVPGIPGRNSASPFFIEAAGTRNPGVWPSEIRLTNTAVIPRAPKDNLATAPLSFNFAGRISKYPKMRTEFWSRVLRGTPEASRLPFPGGFYSLPVKSEIVAKLRSEGITPARFYFAADNWLEYGPSLLHAGRTRQVTAAFTYRTGGGCAHGTARYRQAYDAMAEKFGTAEIEVTKGLPLACTELE